MGDVWMWKIPSGDCKTFQGHGCACNVGCVMPDGMKDWCVGVYGCYGFYTQGKEFAVAMKMEQSKCGT